MKYTSEMLLLYDLKNGKEKAFEYIFHRYYNRLCVFASNFVDETKEAEDIAEEAFVNIWNSKRDFQSILHLKSSLYQTTRRIGLNKQTARHRRMIRTDNYLANQEQFQESQLQHIVYAEAMGELYEAIKNLPPKAQQIIKATYLEGKSNQEVADEMGINLQTVKNQKLRALTILRNRLNKDSFNLLISGVFIIEKFQ
ncbi:RNA polymerase sigma factor [Sphingobacterium pedocola]|uniref:RNA polymerase sigma factor 70 region 4 type 2 domain-containing protein n=1 Tax=Sphingobacterium pedocola TaxID=2082722 RepID=A0ABR9T7G5_9SPHI|nr:sigma-70 family RNA polymerase sigma factor [Sphingobacterium pedocola]MBE8721268.1 hypothetical protein [Sphingobacterium pedocola]